MATQNRGEWSEFYAFLSILSTRKLYLIDNEALSNTEVVVTAVVKEDLRFCSTDTHVFQFAPDGAAVKPRLRPVAEICKVKKCVDSLLACIQGSSGTFSHAASEGLAFDMGVTVKSDRKYSKGDIIVAFKKPDSGQTTTDLPVSVKSWLGSDPTLFNASLNGTRLVYAVEGVSDSDLEELERSKPGARVALEKILSAGGSIVFKRYFSSTMEQNLKTLASSDAIEFLVREHYTKKARGRTTMEFLIKHEKNLKKQKPLERALREFLRASALGMTSSKEWDLKMTASDNYIVVDSDGALRCILGRQNLEEFLFKLAYVDTPSSNKNKHDFGYPYRGADGAWEFALNFQIRLHMPSK